jgi:uncharacterized lipoprotein YajG
MKRLIAILTAASLLAGCASPQNQAMLQQDQQLCVQGDQHACALIPYQQQINQEEANRNGAIAGAIVLLPLLFLAAAAATPPTQEVIIVPNYHHH